MCSMTYTNTFLIVFKCCVKIYSRSIICNRLALKADTVLICVQPSVDTRQYVTSFLLVLGL